MDFLSFKQVVFQYSPQEDVVLKEISLGVQQQTTTAILGPNGVGKTTLLHLVLGWRKPLSGEITLAGQPIQSYSRRELGQKIALVPQSEHITFEYTLLEYVLLGRAPYLRPTELPSISDYEIAKDALHTVGLIDLQYRTATTLSGGEKQLLLMARALAQQPFLLLLDEATAHLDLANKVRFLGVLDHLNERGVTILLSTHEPEIASSIATHLVLMRDGQILHAGHFQEQFTSEKLSTTYGVAVEVQEIEGQCLVTWSNQRNRYHPAPAHRRHTN